MSKVTKIVLDNDKFFLDEKNKTSKIDYKIILNKEESDNLYKKLLDKIPWEQGVYKMYGKEVKTPRLLWAMRDKDFDIKKSYSITESSIWNEDMIILKTKVESIINSKKKFKYAQINYYRDGKDYIGWHSDSEVMEGGFIASVSLGTSRKFQFMNIENNSIKKELMLDNGSLLVMDQNSAKLNWKHRLPKETKINDGRINITFRLR